MAANAGFVAAEFALVAVDRTRVDERAGAGHAGARRVQRLVGRLSYHLSGAQLGITVTSLLLGFIAEPAIAQLIEPAIESIFGGSSTGVSILLALAIATVVQMVMGELVPKTVATSRPFVTSVALARPVAVYGVLARPVVAFLDGMANAIVRRMGIEPREDIESTPDRDELEQLIVSSGEEGVLDAGEVQLLRRSIRLADKSADDAMVPRVSVVAIAEDATVDELVGLSVKTGHSRFPVVGDDLDDVLGVVHVKSVHSLEPEGRAHTTVGRLMTPVPAVPEARELDELLADLREGGSQLAVVIDEHGGTAGIITLEDVLEEIVGEIDDEHDPEASVFTRVEARGSTVIAASLHPDEVNDAVGFEMPEGEYETLAGLVLDRLGHIPEPGEMVEVDGWRIEVVAMDRLRIATVRIVAPPEADAVTGWFLLAAVALLIANAFFVAVEFALIASRALRLEPDAEDGDRRSRVALVAVRDLQRQLAGAQLGITMASLGLGFVAEPAVAHLLESAIEVFFDLPSGVLHAISLVVALAIVVTLHMVLGEMVPKNIAIAGPERTARALAGVHRLYLILFGPVVWALNAMTNGLVRLMGMEPVDELNTALTVNEFQTLLAGARDEGVIEESEHDLLAGALEFRARTAGSLMVPRSEIISVPRATSVGDIEQVVARTGHTRVPVWGVAPDDILGFVHAKDLLRLGTNARDEPVPLELIRRMLVVGPDRSVRGLMRVMRRARIHMAVVRDGDGEVLGLVTLEDVLESLVGDIWDETDESAIRAL